MVFSVMIAALIAAPPAHAMHLWLSETAIDHLESEALHPLLVTHRDSLRGGDDVPRRRLRHWP